MIEVLFRAFINWKMRSVFVVVVLLEQQNTIFGERLREAIGDGCLAGAGAATDSDGQCSRQLWMAFLSSALFLGGFFFEHGLCGGQS